MKGDTLPRPVLAETPSKPLNADQIKGYAPVAWTWYPVQGTDGDTAIVYEKSLLSKIADKCGVMAGERAG